MRQELASIPGYAEAVRREDNVRCAAVATRETIFRLWKSERFFQRKLRWRSNFNVNRLTLRHWLFLEAAGNPLLHSGGPPEPWQVAQFLWVVSTQFHPRAAWRRWRFIRSCRKLEYGTAVVVIRQFVEDSMIDLPPVYEDSKPGPAQVCFALNVIFSVCKAFRALTPEQVKDMPLAESLQAMKLRRMEVAAMNGDGRYRETNPSDAVLNEYRQKMFTAQQRN